MSPISWTTGTQTECLGANNAVGATYGTSVTATAISPPTGAAYCPANFWLPSYGIGKSLLVKASGVLSTTSTPTLNFAVTADSTIGTVPVLTVGTAGVLALTGAVTQQTTLTIVPWELECVITCITTGATGTFLSDGTVKVYYAATNVQSMRLSSTPVSNPNTVTGSTTTLNAYYIELSAQWGTNSSSNVLQVYSYIVMGLN